MPNAQDQLAEQILDGVKRRLGKYWNDEDASTAQDRSIIEGVCYDAAALQLQAMVTPQNADSQRALLHEKSQIEAQLLNVQSIQITAVSDAVWSTVQKVVQAGVHLAFAAV